MSSTKLPSVRVYGPSRSRGSFWSITQGVLSGLRALGVEHGYVPTDQLLDPDLPAPGATADIGLLLGGYSRIEYMHFGSRHGLREFLIAPNGYGVHDNIQPLLNGYKTDPIAPSAWAASILEAEFDRPIRVFQHGIDPALGAVGAAEPPHLPRFLHVTSTATDRKGTLSLIEMWPKDVCLTIHTDAICAPKLNAILAGDNKRIEVVSDHVPRDCQGAYYRSFAGVVQPSRAEGFGLVPLEAVASGVPAFVTNTTGHRDFINMFTNFIVAPVSGETEEIEGEDFPVDAFHTSVVRQYLFAFISECLSDSMLRKTAMDLRHSVVEKWSWAATTKRWLEGHQKSPS